MTRAAVLIVVLALTAGWLAGTGAVHAAQSLMVSTGIGG